MYIEGLDFFISAQDRGADIDLARVIFKAKPALGSTIEIYYVEEQRKQIAAIDHVDSDFGLIYFKNLPFPFSLDYLNIYIDGKKLNADDIEIIADNIIRIINPEFFPIMNVNVETNFNIPIDFIQQYIDVYTENPPKWCDYIKENYLSHLDENGVLVVPDLNLDDLYKKYDPVAEPIQIPTDEYGNPLDSNGNPIIPKVRISPFLNYLVKMIHQGNISKKLDANQLLYFLLRTDFIELMDDEELVSKEVTLDSNNSMIDQIAVFDCEGTLKPLDEILKLIGSSVEEGAIDKFIDFNNSIQNYDPVETANYLYEGEVDSGKLDQIPTVTDFILDANSFSSVDNDANNETATLDLTNMHYEISYDSNDPIKTYRCYDLKYYPISEVLYATINGALYKDGVEFDASTGALTIGSLTVVDSDVVILLYTVNQYNY